MSAEKGRDEEEGDEEEGREKRGRDEERRKGKGEEWEGVGGREGREIRKRVETV